MGPGIYATGCDDEFIRGAALSPDGKTVAMGYKTIYLIDVSQLKKTGTIDGGAVTELCYSPDGKLLAANDQKSIKIFNIFNVAARERTLAIDAAIRGLTFADTTHVAGLGEGKIMRWNTTTGDKLPDIVVPGAMGNIAFSPDGHFVAVPTTGDLEIWDVATGKPVIQLPPPASKNQFYSPVFSHDGKLLAAACNDGTVTLWGLSGGYRLGGRKRAGKGDIGAGKGDIVNNQGRKRGHRK
jgi:WD40 repeat protein